MPHSPQPDSPQPDSYITISRSRGVTSYVGPDATRLFAAIALRSALKMYASCGVIPTRGVTISKMLTRASEITRKRYKRGEALLAAADIDAWILAMRAALPIVEEA